jgi:hypothetical protein
MPFEPSELQQSFRFVGVRPPDISPPSVKKTIFLDEEFDPYRLASENTITEKEAEKGREEHWVKVIGTNMATGDETALIRAGTKYVDPPRTPIGSILSSLNLTRVWRLSELLRENGIEIRVIHRVADVNQVFGK